MSFVLQAWRDSSAEMKAAAAGSIVAVAGGLVALRYTVMGSGSKTSGKIEYKEVGGEGGAAGSGGRVLIIGAGGFIGKEVIKQLVEDKFNDRRSLVAFDTRIPPDHERVDGVKYVQGTIMDMEHLKRAMSGCGSVLHLASLKKFLGVSDALCRSINVDGTKNVIEACKAKNVKNLVYTSSIMVALTFADGFKSEKNMKIKHNAPQSGESVDIYAKTKAEAEALVMEESKSNKLKVCVLRPTAVFGPGDQVCFDENVKGSNNFVIGTGEAEFDWVDSETVARAHALALRSLESRACTAAGNVYNVGMGQVIEYRRFNGFETRWWGLEEPKFIPLGLIVFLANVNEAICWLTGFIALNKALMKTSVIMTQYSWSVDVEKTKRDLGWEPVYPSVKVAIQKQLAAMNIEIK